MLNPIPTEANMTTTTKKRNRTINRMILLGADPFALGFEYGKLGYCWSAREAEKHVKMRNTDDTRLFLNGMEDGRHDDTFRLNLKTRPCETPYMPANVMAGADDY